VTGTASVTIIGKERTVGALQNTQYDSGTLSVTANGFTKSVTYQEFYGSPLVTPSTIAASLSSAFNSDSAAPVTASVAGSVLTLTSKSGSSSSLTIAVSSQPIGDPNNFPGLPSFVGILSGS
jgi:phage tail sheath gpL-like